VCVRNTKAASEPLAIKKTEIIELLDNKIATNNNQVFIIDLEKYIAGNYLKITDRIIRKKGNNQIIIYKK
jgi:hypothetical protein